jgi:hypothetical protein
MIDQLACPDIDRLENREVCPGMSRETWYLQAVQSSHHSAKLSAKFDRALIRQRQLEASAGVFARQMKHDRKAPLWFGDAVHCLRDFSVLAPRNHIWAVYRWNANSAV